MSFDHSRKLIYDIASQREADAHFEGMSKWDGLAQEKGIIEPEEPKSETELER